MLVWKWQQRLHYYYCYIRLTAFSRTTWVSWHQKGKPFWILLEWEMMGWQWHQLGHIQIICTSLQTDNHASTSPLSFYRPDALPAANQQCQSTEGFENCINLPCFCSVDDSVYHYYLLSLCTWSLHTSITILWAIGIRELAKCVAFLSSWVKFIDEEGMRCSQWFSLVVASALGFQIQCFDTVG